MEKKNPGLTETIARFIVETDPSDIPIHIHEHAKVAFLDWFAVLIAGKDEPLGVEAYPLRRSDRRKRTGYCLGAWPKKKYKSGRFNQWGNVPCPGL